MERGNYLAPYRSLKTSARFKGETMQYVTNFSPPNAKPGDTLYVNFPSVKDELIIPGTFSLTFDLEIVLDPAEPDTDVKTYPVHNLAANIISEFRVKIGSQSIYELNNAHLYATYKDLWLTKEKRQNSVSRGICNFSTLAKDLVFRKIRTDLNTTLAASQGLNKLKQIYGKRYEIPINFEIISDHMPMSGALLESNLCFEIKINEVKNVLIYENKTTANFEMKNLCLEFKTIKDLILYKEIERDFSAGVQFLFDHVHHYKMEEIDKEATFINLEIQGLDRKSLKGILLIFENEFKPGERSSELFPNPGITNVKYTIDGIPNKHYSSGYRERDQWNEISQYFMPEEFKNIEICNMDLLTYYTEGKFALWTDLRSTEDNRLHGTGKVHEAKHVIKMEITKNAGSSGKYIMHIYVISDARIIIKDRRLTNFEY